MIKEKEIIIAYTWWTKPLLKDKNKLKHLLYLFALSIKSAENLYEKVHVVTDSYGQELLKRLDLKINISTELDSFERDPVWWSSAKYVTYQKFVNANFIHIDTDVVITRSFFFKSPYLFQKNESLFQLNTVLAINEQVKQKLHSRGIYNYDVEPCSYNVGTFRINNPKILQEYINFGNGILDLLEPYSEEFTVGTAGVILIYCEQQSVCHFIKDEIDEVMGDHYDVNTGCKNFADIKFSESFTKDTGITTEELYQDVFGHLLLNINTSGYLHYCSEIKNNDKIRRLTEYYIEYYHPELLEKLKTISQTYLLD